MIRLVHFPRNIFKILFILINLNYCYGQQDVCNWNCKPLAKFHIGDRLFSVIDGSESEYEIDFGDGNGVQTVAYGSTITTSYPTQGIYFINLFITDTTENGTDTVLVFKKPFKFGCSANPDSTFSLISTIPYISNSYTNIFPIDPPLATDGLIGPFVPPFGVREQVGSQTVVAEGFVSILYGCGNGRKIRKPVIFVEGLDFGDQILIDGQYGDFGWNTFSSGVDNDANDPLPIQYSPEFIRKLNKDGFDMILLDHKDGATYLEANARLLVTLIKKIKQELLDNGSDNEIVLAGASMGGVICKYALKYLELDLGANADCNSSHNVKLFISFDSPQSNMHGANIPIGDQYLLRTLKSLMDPISGLMKKKYKTNKLYSDISKSVNKLSRPAPNELLKYHFQSSCTTGELNQHPLRARMLADPYLDYPVLPRKVAFSCGSSRGLMQFGVISPMVPGIEMIDVNMSYLIHLIKIDMKTFAEPYYSIGLRNIYSIDARFFGTSIRMARYLSKLYPYDSAPGAFRNTNAELDKGGEGNWYVDNPSFFPAHCFIPTLSSLDLNLSETHLFDNLKSSYLNGTDRAYIHSGPGRISPFDAIYAPDDNQGHMELTHQNIGWSMDEISPSQLYLENQNFNKKATYEAREVIEIGNDVDPVNGRSIPGDFTVQPGCGRINLLAGNEVNFKTGFHAKSGAEVSAKIRPMCAPCPLYVPFDFNKPIAWPITGVVNISVDTSCGLNICIPSDINCYPLTYIWSDLSFGNERYPSNLQPGTTYTLTVIDNCGNSGVISFKTPSLIGLVKLPAIAGCNGEFEIKTILFCPPYSYNWTKNGIPQSNQTGSILAGLCEGDEICVTVTTNCNHVQTCCFTFANPSNVRTPSVPASIFVTNAPCYNSNGSVNINMGTTSGGPFSFNWSTGDTTPSIFAKADTLVYSVSNQICTIFNGYAVIHQPFPVMASSSVVNTTCSILNNGSITVHGVGGTPGYHYLWNTGATTQNISTLSNGTYNITITDSNSCSNTFTYSVVSANSLVVSDFNPKSGPSGTEVEMTGTGFMEVDSIFIDGFPCSFLCLNDSLIRFIVPTGVSNGLIKVQLPDCSIFVGLHFQYLNTIALTLKVYLEGFYQTTGIMSPVLKNCNITADVSITDTVSIFLVDPFNLIDIGSGKSIVDTAGNLFISFPGSLIGESYYIKLKHRNSIETWSQIPVQLKANTYYNFTDCTVRAYTSGTNDPLKEVETGVYALFSGDINQDGIVESADYAILENESQSFIYGYLSSDLNGDGIVESADYSLMENNSLLFLISSHP